MTLYGMKGPFQTSNVRFEVVNQILEEFFKTFSLYFRMIPSLCFLDSAHNGNDEAII